MPVLDDAPQAVLPEPFDAGLMGSAAAPVPSYLPPPPPPPTMGASSSLPPLPPPPAAHAPPADGGLHFNDDDDVTQIFDRGAGDSAPPPGGHVGVSSLPPPPGLPLPSFAPPAAPLLTFSDPAPSPEKKLFQRPLVLAALAAVLVIGVLTLVFSSSVGRLVVAVAGPNGTVVDGVTISVDDKVVCTGSPCQLEDLEPRSYLVAVRAEGFERTAPQAVVVRAGEDAVHNVTLQAPLVVAPTGLDIPASGPGFTVSVDGKPLGPLPQKVLELTPGEHVVRVSGGDRYHDLEKTVSVSEGQVLTLQPFELEVKKGRATIEAGDNAEDASVELNGKAIQLPHAVDLDASTEHRLVATREGYQDFERKIRFDDGKAEKTFTITLEPSEEAAAEEPEQTATATSRRSTGSRSRSSSRKSSSGQGTLNITSSPSAMVILDGRPIGKTPKNGIKVSPGAHSIVFVSDKGRKRATTKVAAGDTKTVSVRF